MAGGPENISDIYRLEDHEGNEITISDLIDRYLSNPELCFKKGWDEMKLYDTIRIISTLLTRIYNMLIKYSLNTFINNRIIFTLPFLARNKIHNKP